MIKIQFNFRTILGIFVLGVVIYFLFIRKNNSDTALNNNTENFTFMHAQVGEKGKFCVPYSNNNTCGEGYYCNTSHRCEKTKKMDGFCEIIPENNALGYRVSKNCMSSIYWNSNPYNYVKQSGINHYFKNE